MKLRKGWRVDALSFNTSNLGFSPSAKSQDLFYSVYLDTRQTWKKKAPHSVTKQRPGEGKNNLNQTATFLTRGTLAQPTPRQAAGRHPIPRGPEVEESKESQASQGLRKRGIEGSRNRGIEESRDRGIEGSRDRGIVGSKRATGSEQSRS
jgi:hypothetical protein